ncbi:hypothetical protein [Absidia glauca]|uniref:Peptidyl-prolyl cis-trans isomerase n=1 Tax=Absidia glauca TaxID=4829 RepID=A0A163JIQ0_ABSGL|nr:hypothetical protein [Absidia glauca]
MSDNRSVLFETSMGPIEIELYWDHAPNTCKNFYELTKRGYYDGVSDFMIQGGDPTATGKGGKSIFGDKFADEIHPGLKHTGAGKRYPVWRRKMTDYWFTLNGMDQFFITLAPTPWLDGKHTIFGRISDGMNIVKRMGLVATDSQDRPKDTVKIVRGRVE